MNFFPTLKQLAKRFVYQYAAHFTVICILIITFGSVFLHPCFEAMVHGHPSSRDWLLTAILVPSVLAACIFQFLLTKGLDWRRLHATSIGCRLLSPETAYLFDCAKKTNPDNPLNVRGFVYVVKNGTFVPLASWRESSASPDNHCDGAKDVRSPITFDDAKNSDLVIWSAYTNADGREVRDVSAADVNKYQGWCTKGIDPKIKTVLAMKLNSSKNKTGLISFTCNHAVRSAWEKDEIWDMLVGLADELNKLIDPRS